MSAIGRRVISDDLRGRAVAALELCQSDEAVWSVVLPMLNLVSSDGVFNVAGAESDPLLAFAALHVCIASSCLHHAGEEVGPEQVASHLCDQLARLPVDDCTTEAMQMVGEIRAHDAVHFALIRVGTVAQLLSPGAVVRQ